MRNPTRILAIIGPGILVAATGVGAGDLATGAFAGGKLGVAVLWAVIIGAGLKFVLNEGLARWQLATGDTLLEGSVNHLGAVVQWAFLIYLLIWSFFVGSALMSAVGVTSHAILPVFSGENAAQYDKILYGLLHSAVAVVLVRIGGYKLFEKVMSVCIAVMFVVVVATAIMLRPSPAAILSGMFVPSIPQSEGEGLQWVVALMGGVGGTLTVLCYGYWIREEGRQGGEALRACRIDLALGYGMTALFGMAMVVIGASLGGIEGGGAGLVVKIAERLERELGVIAKWAFLAGAWGAVFSSLLGVWQSVPYLFADFWQLMRGRTREGRVDPVDTKSVPYQAYLYGLASVPAIGLVGFNFEAAQKLYAIIGALFIPLLAVVLLLLNGRQKWVGAKYVNSWLTTAALVAALLFFLASGVFEVRKELFPESPAPQAAKL